MDFLSGILSVLALFVSIFTLWFTVIRRGQVLSTRPAFIAFRYDFVDKEVPQAKIFLRTLLYCTGKRGQVVEYLFLRVHSGSRNSEFSFWGYGDKDLVRGSGIFVPEEGIATNHHFNPLDSDNLFEFPEGMYSLELVAKILGKKRPQTLWTETLELPGPAFAEDIDPNTAIFFNWSAEQEKYIGTIEQRSHRLRPEYRH